MSNDVRSTLACIQYSIFRNALYQYKLFINFRQTENKLLRRIALVVEYRVKFWNVDTETKVLFVLPVRLRGYDGERYTYGT